MRSPLKVLVDCVPLAVGGGVQVAIAVLVGLKRQALIDWVAIVPVGLRSALPAELVDDGRIIYVNRRSQVDRVWLTPYLMLLERKIAPDVVFTVFGPPFFRARAPHIVGFALPRLIYARDAALPPETLLDKIGDRARAFLFRQADFQVVETETAKMRLSARIGVDPQLISVIPNSPNPLLRAPAADEASMDGRFVVLIPSAYYQHKNLEIVPRVAAAFKRMAPDLDFVFRFTLAVASEGWQRIKAEAERLGVGERIETLGVVKITDLSQAYRDASAIYLPTLREVSSAVYPESFLFRRPLVTTDMDFARELCGDGALFVPPHSPEDAAAAFSELARSPEVVAALVEAGSRQLSRAYPTAEEKFRMQIDLIRFVAAAGHSR